MTNNFAVPILSSNNPSTLKRLVEFAEFWKIPYRKKALPENNDVVFSSGLIGRDEQGDHPIIISPRGIEDARRIASQYDLSIRSRAATLSLPLGKNDKISLHAEIVEFVGQKLEPVISHQDNHILSRLKGTKIHLLSLDIVGEYESRLYGGLEDSPSTRFRLLSKLPVPYSIVPATIRDWLLRRSVNTGQQYSDPAPVEFLRILFLASLATLSENPIPRIGFWKHGKSYAMVITHDVETSRGLHNGAKQLLRVEKEIGVRSTWNIPSDRYKISGETLRDLARDGDIGAHDTLHDGRLILSQFEQKIERARQAKEKLERLSGTHVQGFRAPLLQHSGELLTAIGKAGYEFDSSTPSWETVSPTSSKPHGTGTVFPFQYNGVWEVPVSLPQDHQLTRIRKLSINEAVSDTIAAASHIQALGGACILLVHPDYEYALSDNLGDYRRLIESFHSDPTCDLMTMKQMVSWWKTRDASSIDTASPELSIIQRGTSQGPNEQLSIETVTGYDDMTGLRIQKNS